MEQIGCNLTDEEAEELNRYAAAMELTRPSLCVLLIHRELRQPRLNKLKAVAAHPIGEATPKRVTVRVADQAFKKAFSAHVRTCGLGSDEAVAILFRAELKERWIFKTFSWSWNRC